MLGRIHGSVEHFYIPHLIYLNEKVRIESKQRTSTRLYGLYKLDWESVDSFKKNYWKKKFPKSLEDQFATLPERYDNIIKKMLFALPYDAKSEIEHFTQIYYTERHRVRHFDTMIRDVCLEVSEAAIGCAFKLLSDYIYDNKTWFRDNHEIDKRLACHLMMYKFWREIIGRGCVWEYAEMDKLEKRIDVFEKTKLYRDVFDKTKMYRTCLNEIRRWEEDQEKFYDFVNTICDFVCDTIEVREEKVEVKSCGVRHEFGHRPVILETVRLHIVFNNQSIVDVSFDQNGKINCRDEAVQIVINDKWIQSIKIDQTRSMISNQHMELILCGGEFPNGAVGVVNYTAMPSMIEPQPKLISECDETHSP